MQPEARLKARIVRCIKSIDGVWAYPTADRFRAGIPDILGVFRGKAFAIEVKLPTGRVSEIQRLTLEKIHEAGGYVCIARSVEDAASFLAKIQ